MSSITPGKLVYWDNKAAIVLELKGFSEAIIRIVESGVTEIVRASNLSLRISTPDSEQGKHLLAKDKEWEVALSRFETIKPLLEKSTRTESDVERVAFECGKGVTTIYRWLKQFEETGLVSSLLRQQRTDKGHHKLNAEVEELIATQITKIYLQKERPSVLKLYRIIKSECIDADLPVPHKNLSLIHI